MAKGIPSVTSHTFSEVPKAMISRSSFDRSHGHKTTLDASYLTPIYVDEALPGDTFSLNMTGFARMATPIKPIMDNLFMETFFFSVPNRLLWDNWETFITTDPGADPDNPVTAPLPAMTLPPGAVSAGGIFDHMGLPIYSDANVVFSELPFRAYKLIFNEWFRDENLQTVRQLNTSDTPSDLLQYNLEKRNKRHDYFTSCLPWPQKGEEVTLPTLGTAPVISDPDGTGRPRFTVDGVGGLFTLSSDGTNNAEWQTAPAAGLIAWSDTQLVTDLASATAATINDLRVAFQLQKMLERDARGGTRYTETIHAHFGVTSPDARLQRPEYLGGGRTRVNVNPVQQTAPTDGTSPQGNLAAYGTASMMNHGFTKSFTEHCTLIGLVNIRADLTYQEGLNRMWRRRGRYDFFWPAFQHIGEQEVYADEIYASSDNDANPIFGYQERYAEYRYKPSVITGKFRSNAPDSLDIWHLSQDFQTTPRLNSLFMAEDVPMDRVLAIPSEPDFLFDAYFKLRCARPMPLYGVPGNIDRF
ncbi:major capsid protein [Microviridae sp.]|nr:major capsid protein [Microviridae sp.]